MHWTMLLHALECSHEQLFPDVSDAVGLLLLLLTPGKKGRFNHGDRTKGTGLTEGS